MDRLLGDGSSTVMCNVCNVLGLNCLVCFCMFLCSTVCFYVFLGFFYYFYCVFVGHITFVISNGCTL